MNLAHYPPSTIFRPARQDDLEVLASLLVQLYDAEPPGAFLGGELGRRSLLQFTLEANPNRSLRHRYVLETSSGEVVATGMVQLPTDPPFERAPRGTLIRARELIGYAGAARLLATVGRSMLSVYALNDPGGTLFHSVVVDKNYRRYGLGQFVMRQLESQAAQHGFSQAYVQVLSANETAYRLYEHLGYQQVWQTPHWKSALTWPSRVMKKTWAPNNQGRQAAYEPS